MEYLNAHFKRSEFACDCGCGFDTADAALLEALRQVRAHFGSPVFILSGCRCPKQNKAVRGAANSQHLYARASDIFVVGYTPAEVAAYCRTLEGVSVGEYEGHVHIDTRTGPPVYWSLWD